MILLATICNFISFFPARRVIHCFLFYFSRLHEQLMTSMRAGLVAQSKKEKEYEIKIIELHQRICDAVCTRDPERAVQAMAEHFENAIDALID